MDIAMLQNTPQEALATLSDFVKKVRLNREMTIEELASRSGVSRSTIIRFEKHGTGTTETLVKIFTVLDVLGSFMAALAPPEKELTIAELKKLGTSIRRQRVRRKTHALQ